MKSYKFLIILICMQVMGNTYYWKYTKVEFNALTEIIHSKHAKKSKWILLTNGKLLNLHKKLSLEDKLELDLIGKVLKKVHFSYQYSHSVFIEKYNQYKMVIFIGHGNPARVLEDGVIIENTGGSWVMYLLNSKGEIVNGLIGG